MTHANRPVTSGDKKLPDSAQRARRPRAIARSAATRSAPAGALEKVQTTHVPTTDRPAGRRGTMPGSLRTCMRSSLSKLPVCTARPLSHLADPVQQEVQDQVPDHFATLYIGYLREKELWPSPNLYLEQIRLKRREQPFGLSRGRARRNFNTNQGVISQRLRTEQLKFWGSLGEVWARLVSSIGSVSAVAKNMPAQVDKSCSLLYY